MLFLILFVFIGIKLVSCCRKYSKDLEEEHEELTFAKVTSKNWFKVLVFLRMVLFVVCCVLGYYFSYGFGDGDKWADEAVESWDEHFEGFHQHAINITLPMDCQAEFQATIAENLAFVENYSLGINDECLGNLSLDADGIARLTKSPGGFSIKSIGRKMDKPLKYPILVTAVTELSFLEIIGLIENIKTVLHKAFPKMEAVIFDFGLSVEHHEQIVSNCSFCDVQSYPAEQLDACEANIEKPNATFAQAPGKRRYESIYKPALIQVVLQHHDFVMWINESIRFDTSSSFKKIVKGIKGKSIQLPMSEETIEERGINEDMFAVLDEEPCLYQQQNVLDTKLMLIRRNNFTVYAVMRPWVASAFTYMSLPQRQKKNGTTKNDDKADSSLLSIILSRLFSMRKQIFLFDFPGTYDESLPDDSKKGGDIIVPNKMFEIPVDDIRNSDLEIVAIGNDINSKHPKAHVTIEGFQNENHSGTIQYN
ncbi:uncharacterized protein LOC110447686 [Mizuhopecten yessoensis]|uniref:Uncharacterized protein n=1 Tax=Mizuhopecten yessoensis TaxID=6573 RepID=A0A210QUW5_MIZYE|nr:uncharacterized protein LOC110447686 [Mizuhopecten yessoensis]OWF52515.1 hypothetical protein KP79_PYT06828 [Mizuhopecten yessoensis]